MFTVIVCIGILLAIAAGYGLGLKWVFEADHPKIDKIFDRIA